MFSYFFPFQFEIKQFAILLPWKLFLSNESRSFCTRLFLFRFINRNRNTAQKEYALSQTWGSPVSKTLSSFSSLPLPFTLYFILYIIFCNDRELLLHAHYTIGMFEIATDFFLITCRPKTFQGLGRHFTSCVDELVILFSGFSDLSL